MPLYRTTGSSLSITEGGIRHPRRTQGWVSDAHTSLPDGTPKLRKDGQPTREPGYSVGDDLVIYDLEFSLCVARVRVQTRAPRFDPSYVRRSSPEDAKRWGWVTEVEPIAISRSDADVRLGDLRIKQSSIGQKDHIRLRADQYAEARRLIPLSGERRNGWQRRSPPARPSSTRIPIEQQHVEESTLRDPPESRSRVLRRREQTLVLAYASFLEHQGRSVSSRKLYDESGGGADALRPLR